MGYLYYQTSDIASDIAHIADNNVFLSVSRKCDFGGLVV